nr:hypothetical protein TetV2_00221 [Oceanusvirus sp.]
MRQIAGVSTALRSIHSPNKARVRVDGRVYVATRIRHNMSVKPECFKLMCYTVYDESAPDVQCTVQYVVAEGTEDGTEGGTEGGTGHGDDADQ